MENLYNVYGEWFEECYIVARDVPFSVALEIESHEPNYFVMPSNTVDGLPF